MIDSRKLVICSRICMAKTRSTGASQSRIHPLHFSTVLHTSECTQRFVLDFFDIPVNASARV